MRMTGVKYGFFLCLACSMLMLSCERVIDLNDQQAEYTKIYQEYFGALSGLEIASDGSVYLVGFDFDWDAYTYILVIEKTDAFGNRLWQYSSEYLPVPLIGHDINEFPVRTRLLDGDVLAVNSPVHDALCLISADGQELFNDYMLGGEFEQAPTFPTEFVSPIIKGEDGAYYVSASYHAKKKSQALETVFHRKCHGSDEL